MQILMAMKCQLILERYFKQTTQSDCDRDIVVGKKKGKTTLRNSLTISYEVKHKPAVKCSNSPLMYLPLKMQIYAYKERKEHNSFKPCN